jgi:hypothetical protein
MTGNGNQEQHEEGNLVIGYSNGTGSIVHLSSLLAASPGTVPAFASIITGSKVGISTMVRTNLGGGLIALGNSAGEVYLFHSTVLSTREELPNEGQRPALCFSRSSITAKAPITSLIFSPRSASSIAITVGTVDGLPYRAILEYQENGMIDNVRVGNEFAGFDCDPAVVAMRCGVEESEEEVWIGGGDGVLRRYRSI